MLTGASFNALLKTLEEPPPYIVFIFATTAPEKVPLTILGRCQRFDFKRLKVEEIIDRLKLISDSEKIKIDDESLFFMAKKGDGSMRDAQGIFDMAAAYTGNNIKFDKIREFFNLVDSDVYFNITGLIKSKNGGGLLDFFEELMNRGYEMQTFLEGLTEHYRNLLVAVSTGSVKLIVESEPVKEKYKQTIGTFSEIEIINSLKLILQTNNVFKYSSNQRILIEALLMELLKFTDTKEIGEIAEELKKLKNSSPKPAAESNISYKAETVAKVNVNYVHPSPPPVSPEQEENTQAIPVSHPVSPISNVSISSGINEINSHWSAIKDLIGTEKKWIHSIIKDSSIELSGNDNVRLAIDDAKYEVVNSYKEYLTEKISDYFGRNILLSFIKYSDTISPVQSEAPLSGSEPESNFEKLRSILVKEFNAKEIR
jgi:DNA polymerase-3 subunit gamma/tau